MSVKLYRDTVSNTTLCCGFSDIGATACDKNVIFCADSDSIILGAEHLIPLNIRKAVPTAHIHPISLSHIQLKNPARLKPLGM